MSIGEVLSRALSDTLMGMGTVFIILILISLIISLFKFIPGGDKAPSHKHASEDKVNPAVITGNGEDNIEDDGEIVAAVLAAIRMYREQEALAVAGGSEKAELIDESSYIVRSIKRRR